MATGTGQGRDGAACRARKAGAAPLSVILGAWSVNLSRGGVALNRERIAQIEWTFGMPAEFRLVGFDTVSICTAHHPGHVQGDLPPGSSPAVM